MLPSCSDALFVDAISEASWTNIDVGPDGGTAGIHAALALAANSPQAPVRIRLAPGTYADNSGAEIYAQHIQRTASSPLAIVATDAAPNHTTVMQGFNFVGVSYVAFDGITIGPATVGAWNGTAHADPQPMQAQAGVHIVGVARDAKTSALNGDGSLNQSVYGKYDPSHHIVVRNMTIQNIFGHDDPSGEFPVGQDMDGMKLSQVEYAWVSGNTVTQTSRHGMDNVGVHHVAYCNNVISRNGAGQGLEAKGGSIDVLYEGNLFYRVRRVALGGEGTDATYYWSADGLYTYEAKHTVARNNLVVDPREAAFDFSGCLSCSLLDNTVLFTHGYQPPMTESGDANGGDAIRMDDSAIQGTAEGAGSDCETWDANANDYVVVNPCWGVGSNAPAPIERPLPTANPRAVNNVFANADGTWSTSFGSSNQTPATIPCPLNLSTSTPPTMAFDYNYWWNGTRPLPDTSFCGALAEGAHSAASTSAAAQSANLTALLVDGTSISSTVSSVRAALVPTAGSPLIGAGQTAPVDSVAHDQAGHTRTSPWSIGALNGP